MNKSMQYNINKYGEEPRIYIWRAASWRM